MPGDTELSNGVLRVKCYLMRVGARQCQTWKHFFKYTPRDSIISLQAGMQDGRLTVTVSDNGPGIAVEQRDKVFERFGRREPDRSTAGNGLGLSL